MHKKESRNFFEILVLVSFFISGCSALMYQVSWQRALHALIGVDMDSITIIVSVFMLGIGLGGMLEVGLPTVFRNNV